MMHIFMSLLNCSYDMRYNYDRTRRKYKLPALYMKILHYNLKSLQSYALIPWLLTEVSYRVRVASLSSTLPNLVVGLLQCHKLPQFDQNGAPIETCVFSNFGTSILKGLGIILTENCQLWEVQDMQCTYNVTLRRVHETTVTVGKR